MIDYSLGYKDSLPAGAAWPTDLEWDHFVSAFDGSERVTSVFQKVRAARKLWVMHSEYGIDPSMFPGGDTYSPGPCNEDDFVAGLFNALSPVSASHRICLDITGFLKPHMMLILRYLQKLPQTRVHLLYSEPLRYRQGELTQFSDETVLAVRQVAGFEGNHVLDTSRDLLVIGTGYDSVAMTHVAESKGHARKVQLFGLPSLMPDMYQENVLRVHLASESIGIGPGDDEPDNHFAPANDPFVTANVTRDVVERARETRGLTNLYLCPTGTKPQALGFALYYLNEWDGLAASILFPFCRGYGHSTGTGLARTWMYTVEF